MMKYLLTASLICASSLAMAGDRFGLAESAGSFEITRADQVVVGRANSMTEIQAGDAVAASSDNLRISTATGETILVSSDSNVAVPKAGVIELKKGVMALSAPAGSTMAAKYGDLAVAPIPTTGAKADSTPILLMTQKGADFVELQALNQSFAVRSESADKQVATLTSGDTVSFIRNDEGWQLFVPKQGQGEDTLATDNDLTADEGDSRRERRRKAGYWWIIPAAVGTAGAGGALGWYLYTDHRDDDHHHRNRDRNDGSPTHHYSDTEFED